MKKHLLIATLLTAALVVNSQQLVPGSIDHVGLTGYPSEPQLVEADAQGFYWISGSNVGTSVNHVLLPEVYSDFSNLFFIKYDRDGIARKSNYIRGISYAENAFSFKGGLALGLHAYGDIEINGNSIPIGEADETEVLVTYDADCNLQKYRKIWDLTYSQYVNSEFAMDPADGSLYVFDIAQEPMELLDHGTLGKDFPGQYFYLVKYNRNLELEWVYEAGFDTDLSGNSPSYQSINVHPGQEGAVLITGSYGTESSPLIHGRSLPAYADTYGHFAVMLNVAGASQWVQDGPMNGFGYRTGIFEACSMPGGDFVLAGVCTTGYFKLGNAEILQFRERIVHCRKNPGHPI